MTERDILDRIDDAAEALRDHSDSSVFPSHLAVRTLGEARLEIRQLRACVKALTAASKILTGNDPQCSTP